MFDLQRFLRLARAHWAEHRKTYAWFIGIVVMLHFVLLLIIFFDKNGFLSLTTRSQGEFYQTGLFLLLPIFAARYFQRMSQRQSGLLILMRPASVFEKWLLAFLWVAVLFPIAYTVAFYVCDVPAWLIAKGQAQQRLAELTLKPPKDQYLARMLDDYKPEHFQLFSPLADLSWPRMLYLCLYISSFQAFAVFGSLYFRTMPYIKTMVAAFVILLVAIFLSTVLDTRPDQFFRYWESQEATSKLQSILYPVAWFAIPSLLWLSCFLALKEREIAS